MPKSCAAWGCTSHNMKSEKLVFSIFPCREKHKKRWEKWVQAVRRANDTTGQKWQPRSKCVYLCGKHFISGRSHKDPDHPDYVPSIFAFKNNDPTKNKNRLNRYSSAKKRLETPKVMRTPLMTKHRLVFTSPENTALADESRKAELSEPSTELLSSPATPYVSILKPGNLQIPRMSGKSPPFDQDIVECSREDTESCSEEVDEMFTATSLISSAVQDDERQMLYEEINNLRREKRELKEQLERNISIDYTNICNKDVETRYLAGLSSSVFVTVFTFLVQFMSGNKIKSISLENQFLITLIKLRLNVPFEYIGKQHGVAAATATRAFWRWTRLISRKLGFVIKWSDREIIRQTVPPVFKSLFPRLTGIMDCFEIFTVRPKGLLARQQLYSNYKRHSTIKVLIVCSPNGAINFLSRCWGGRVSDVELVKQSGLLELPDHMPGDQILADRGFTLRDAFAAACGVELIVPSFTKGRKQLTAKEVETSREISSIRIHIERVIGLMRNRYTILKGPVNINLIKSLTDELSDSGDSDMCSFDHILTSCGSLTNLGEGIVYKE